MFLNLQIYLGLVQKSPRQMEETREERDERGCGSGGRFQIVIYSAIQRFDATVRAGGRRGQRSSSLRRRIRSADIQQLGRKSAQSSCWNGQEFPVGSQFGEYVAAKCGRVQPRQSRRPDGQQQRYRDVDDGYNVEFPGNGQPSGRPLHAALQQPAEPLRILPRSVRTSAAAAAAVIDAHSGPDIGCFAFQQVEQ